MSKFFIERPILANVMAIITIVIGIVCVLNLPIAEYPNIVPPTIQVSTNYPGASAEVVANTVGIPIEQAINGVENSIYMESTSGSDGSYTLTVTFSIGTDLDTSLALVQNAANSSLAQLPAPVQAQGVNVRKVSTSILLIESLYSDDNRFDESFLSNYAIINLQNPIARLPGVGQVQILGAGPYSMRIWLDPQKLDAFGLTVLDVQNAIESQNAQVAAGQLGGPPVPKNQVFQFTVNTLGRLSDVTQFENIVIKSSPPATLFSTDLQPSGDKPTTASIVRLKDVARVELGQQVFSVFSGLSGKKAAHMAIFALPGANALEVGEATRALMAEMSKNFPEGLKYSSLYDTTVFIDQSIDAVYQTLFIAGVLVLIVIMLFLQNLRAMLVPATTVPVTIIGAFAAMALLGFTINLMTLFALILAIGIVVDDAIVIVENASHHIERGLAPKDAAIEAMKELTGPVLGITLVLISVFLPASFLPGISGQMFQQFALVIAATAVISAMNALTLKPTQCALYLRPRPKDYQPNWFYRGFNRVYGAIEARYVGLVTRMVRRPRLMLTIFFIVVGLAFFGFSKWPTALMPLEDQGYCVVVAELSPGAAQPRVRAVSDAMDAVLKETPGIKGWVTIGGYSALDSAKLSTVITTFAIYEDWGKRPGLTQADIIADLQHRFTAIRAASFAVLPPSPIPGLGTAFGFDMMVEDRGTAGLAELQKLVNDILHEAQDRPGFLRLGFTTFSADSPQLYLDIDRVMAESLGVEINNVFSTLQTYLGSTYVNQFNKFNQSFQVRLQADAEQRRSLRDIGRLFVANRDQQMVPLGALLDVRQTLGSELVTRYNLYPAASLIGIPNPRYSSGEAMEIMHEIATSLLPAGMSYDWTGLSYQEQLIGNQMYLVFGLSILLVFLVLSAQYESWSDPVTVVLVVPMAIVGIITALAIRLFPIDLYTQIGLVLIIALAAKNAILIVEFARQLSEEGMTAPEAAVEATRRRFRPILMTSLAFILGVVPLMTATGAGAASQQAIGTVVFGGMMASTLLAIPFVPVFFVAVRSLSERSKPAPAPVPQRAG